MSDSALAPENHGIAGRVVRDPVGAFLTVWQLLASRWQARRCKKVGRLLRIWGKLIVDGGDGITLGDRLRIRASHLPVELAAAPGAVLHIGNGVFINSGVSIGAAKSITIGNNVAIGNYTLIMDTDFHTPGDHLKIPEPQAVVIEDNAWLGARVTVLKGVRIGRGATVAAGAVVTRDVAAGSIVGGVPAKPLKTTPTVKEMR